MMYCCSVFEESLQNAGNKGISAVAHYQDGFRFFCLQSRACDHKDESKLKNIPWSEDVPRLYRVVEQIAIKFCPFCGTQFDSLITARQLEFDELAKLHERFLLK
jgi:hypothetical protein